LHKLPLRDLDFSSEVLDPELTPGILVIGHHKATGMDEGQTRLLFAGEVKQPELADQERLRAERGLFDGTYLEGSEVIVFLCVCLGKSAQKVTNHLLNLRTSERNILDRELLLLLQEIILI
jgi:hypothetical protein